MRHRAVLSAIPLLVAAACGDGGTEPDNVSSISISTAATSVPVASQLQLSATARDVAGNTLSGVTFTWSSSAAGVASVNTNGLVTGVAPGTATITAASKSASGTLDITVTQSNGAVVFMPGNSFVPFQVSIRVGGTVLFEFPAEQHNVIFDTKAGAPTDIQNTSNRSVTRVFSVAGNFPYECRLHPGMTGVVAVSP